MVKKTMCICAKTVIKKECGTFKMSKRNYDVILGDKAGYSPVKMWTRGVPVEQTAIDQIKNMASMPFIHKHISIMPDAHWGNGACVGSVIPTVGAIIPAACWSRFCLLPSTHRGNQSETKE